MLSAGEMNSGSEFQAARGPANEKARLPSLVVTRDTTTSELVWEAQTSPTPLDKHQLSNTNTICKKKKSDGT